MIRKGFQVNHVPRYPFSVRFLRSDGALDLFIGNNAAFGCIDKEHPTGLQTVFSEYALGLYVENAHFGCHDDQVVPGDVVARRAQSVAVKHGTDLRAVGEGNRRGAVPGLHQTAVIFVKRLFFGLHAPVARPGLGNDHHCGMSKRAAGENKKFEYVVENAGVASIFQNNRVDIFDGVAEHPGENILLPGLHPVDVAPERVDLAVMAEKAVWMSPIPAREGIGAETRVHHGDGAFHILIVQLGIIGPYLLGKQHALIDNGFAGETRNIEIAAAENACGVFDPLGDSATNDIQLSFKLDFRSHILSASDKKLFDDRLFRSCCLTKRFVLGGHLSEPEKLLSLRLDHLTADILDSPALRNVRRQKNHADAVVFLWRQFDIAFRTDPAKELVGNLQKNTRTVSGVFFASAGTAVLEIFVDLQALFDNCVRLDSFDVSDKSHSAGIMLELRIV